MPDNPIDVWSVESFDSDLKGFLNNHAAVIVDYYRADRQIFVDHDLGRNRRSGIRPDNPHFPTFQAAREALAPEMNRRHLRAFHYTRLCDDEIARLNQDGIEVSSPESLERRLSKRVATGEISREEADRLYAASPIHKQLAIRGNRFWMTTHPFASDDGGVTPLMRHWGGEVGSMWVHDGPLLAKLGAIGRPRILEVSVPLASTRHAYRAAESVVAAFGRSIGVVTDDYGFSLYVDQALPASAILDIHSEGDPAYNAIGRGYPANFVDRRGETHGEE